MRSNAGVEGFFVFEHRSSRGRIRDHIPSLRCQVLIKGDTFCSSHLSALIYGKYFSSSNRSSVQETFPADLRRFFRRFAQIFPQMSADIFSNFILINFTLLPTPYSPLSTSYSPDYQPIPPLYQILTALFAAFCVPL
jgi:hypothetical protein